MSALQQEDRVVAPRVPWGAVGLFLTIAYALMWLVMIPFYTGTLKFEGTNVALFAGAAMWAPAVATLVVLVTVDRGRQPWRRIGMGRVNLRRWLIWMGLAVVVPIAAFVLLPFVSAALGWAELDLVGLSGLRAMLQAQLAPTGLSVEEAMAGTPLWVVVAAAPVNMVVGAMLNVVLGAWGEEIGWRGWLQPALSPLGRWPAYGFVGVVWALWHAPVILLGYNYPSAPVAGVFMFIPFCILWSVLLGWARDASDSVWPAALGHGAINASASFYAMLLAEGAEVSNFVGSPLGVAGWVIPGALVVALALRGAPKEPEPA